MRRGSDSLLIVVGPGGLDAALLDRLELQFDQALKDVTHRPVNEVAAMGEVSQGCAGSQTLNEGPAIGGAASFVAGSTGTAGARS